MNLLDRLSVHRPVYQLEDLNKESNYVHTSKTYAQRLRKKWRLFRTKRCLFRTVPILKWLPKYHFRRNILSDLNSGLTIAIMQIPQGMAYGHLGGVPPVVGLYMAFFPVLTYFIFGTSRHVSIGTIAIVCLLTGKVVAEFDAHNSSGTNHYTHLDVATSLTFTVAIVQLVMYVLRLGIITTLLSDSLISGFTCASAFLVISTLAKDLFGLKFKKAHGFFVFPQTVYSLCMKMHEINPYTTILTVVTATILISYYYIVKGIILRRTKAQFPIQLVVVILGSAFSYFYNFHTEYGIGTLGVIATGLPFPKLPSFELMPIILLDAFIIAVVSYTVTMSMALVLARQVGYEVSANQEMLALALSNFTGAFFSCMPVGASLSRSTLQKETGGVTQVTSLMSCVIILGVLLWIGPAFQSLPKCVLACIIIVALTKMMLQILLVVHFFRLSKWDAFVWVVTFVATLIIDISLGLALGVLVSFLSVLVQSFTPFSSLLGVVPNTDLYMDLKRHKNVVEIPGTKIFRYAGGLSFASREAFKKLLFKRIKFDPVSVLRKLAEAEEAHCSSTEEVSVKFVILDFSAITFIDPSGVELLRLLHGEFEKLEIALYIANCSDRVYERFIICGKYVEENRFVIFATIHDAVLYVKSKSENE